jgi:acyl-coenzyme A thioesterase PaaI-like protein
MSDQPLAERRRVAQLLRELAREVTTAAVPDADFAPVAGVLARVRDGLVTQPRLVREVAGLHVRGHASERFGREPVYDRDPLCGVSNPLAPPLRRVEGGRPAEWEVTFGDVYEGHPGFVHGGYVAAVVDHVLGVTASSAGVASMTGTLTTRYRKPTPLHVRLVCVGEVDRVEGRKVFCRATLEAEGTLVAEAEGIYLRVDPDRY